MYGTLVVTVGESEPIQFPTDSRTEYDLVQTLIVERLEMIRHDLASQKTQIALDTELENSADRGF